MVQFDTTHPSGSIPSVSSAFSRSTQNARANAAAEKVLELEARIKELEADVDALVKTRGELLKENARLEAEVRRIHDALLQERKAAGGSAGRADDRSLRAEVAAIQRELADAITKKEDARKAAKQHQAHAQEMASKARKHLPPGAAFACAAVAFAAGAGLALTLVRPRR